MRTGRNWIRTRRQPPGTVNGVIACIVATLVVAAVASENRSAGPKPVVYSLPELRILASPGFDAHSVTDPRILLERFYQSGDGRYLNYTRAALVAREARTVADGLVQIRLDSAAHRFRSAANRARKLLAEEPYNTEARLLRADALRRVGDVDAARRDCLALALVSDAVVGQWCAVQILLSEGRAQDAHQLARKLLVTPIRTGTATDRWSAEIAAEAAAQAGSFDAAAEIYEQLTSSTEAALSARLAYADLLLQQRRSDAALELLAKDTARLAAQVRVAIAMKQRRQTMGPGLRSAIDAAFAGMSPDMTSDLRLRDRAIFELRYTADLQLALRYALANWQQQKGPEDLTLLADAANAAKDASALDIVAQWRARFGSGAGS